ncbi:RNA exonuclease 1 homolog isoform X2 [Tetranychus urticae]|uniref:RNA exonuclease 1 homolog isoform X2 n=1 Tax=Tetranychus urticae TaxID=32264 RepID=UPI00077BC512|nr:RNA exonuclease 1 homolog isoform X2 [Tetranychus urticae]
MLPTSGYFKNLHCPYYKSGFCCRPHCHYKHASVTTAKTYIPTPINKIPEYKPTPIAELRKRKASELSNSNEPLVKVKKEPIDDECDIIATIVGDKANASEKEFKDKTKEINKESIKDKASNQLNGKLNKTKTQPTVKEELKKKKLSKDSKTDLTKSINKSTSEEKKLPPTKESVKSSSSKNPCTTPSSTKLNHDGTKKSVKVSATKSDDSASSSLTSQSSTVDTSKKSPSKLVADSQKKDDLAELLESPPTEDELNQVSVAKKSRVAHSGPSELTMKLSMAKKPVKLTPSQIMFNRFNDLASKESINEPLNDANAKKRIAHNSIIKTSSSPSTAQKATPALPTKRRPVIPNEFGGKIPMAIRTRYLNNFIDELLKFTSEDESYSRGLLEEKTIYTRSTSKNVYLNLAVNTIKRIRNEANAKNSNSSSPSTPQTPTKSADGSIGNRPVSHEMILNGPHAEGCSIEKRRVSISVQDLSDAQLYTALKRYIMSINKLSEYGYPRPDPQVKGKAILPPSDAKCKNNFSSSRRICHRCMKNFAVDEFGYPLSLETCVYHSGRLWNERFNRSIEKKYSCCKGDSSTGGCCSGKSHVVDGTCHPNYLMGYVHTGPKAADSNGFFGIYALDCEMSYTTVGLELTRVSVIDHKLKCVYESLVKPDNPVLDYNTKFSGIKEGDLDKVEVSLKDVQQKLLALIGDKTILIGHSLESDLKALKIIHDTVIDTAEVFPHRRGLPYKRALRTLMVEFLQSIIQNDVDGHDSQEDAVACMKLMLWKVSQDLSKVKR